MPGSETRAAVGSSSLMVLSSVIIAGSYISDHCARHTSGGNALRWGVGACPLSRRVLGQRPGPDGGQLKLRVSPKATRVTVIADVRFRAAIRPQLPAALSSGSGPKRTLATSGMPIF